MNGFSAPGPAAQKISLVFLFFTVGSFLIMTAGSFYVKMFPENPQTGEFLISAAGPVFWASCSLWILFNVLTFIYSRIRSRR